MMRHDNVLYRGASFEEVNIGQMRFYWLIAIFTIANVVLPILLHQLPMGGRMFLPIYFFTLVAGYRFGWKVGATTAISSAVISFLLTGMPPLVVLPFVLFKGFFLGVSAGIVARVSKLPLLLNLILIVVSYQLIGSIFEWLILRDMKLVLSDITVGYIGLLIQIFGGAFVINTINPLWRKNH